MTALVKITCGRCRAQRTEAEWTALPAVTQVSSEELAGVVNHWPEHLVIVVRTCSCGVPIARSMRRQAS